MTNPTSYQLGAQFGFDQYGDAVLQLNVNIPPDAVFTPEQIEGFGRYLIETAAQARAHASVHAYLVREGNPPEMVAQLMRQIFPAQ